MGLVSVEGVVTGPTGISRTVTFLVDSGAKYSLLPHGDWRALELTPRRRMTFILADGTQIEQTAIEAVQPSLAPGQATVGTRVDVAHLAATPVGMTVTITVELAEVDRRRLAFRVEVRDELDEAGKGTHERFLVDAAQRIPRLQ